MSGSYQIVEVKLQGPAHLSKKVEDGDEIVQVNYQTVVGWRFKAVWELIQEASTQLFLTLKKRPRHSSVYGQIYFKPYRLPSDRKRNPTFMGWHVQNLPSPRPELLTIPHFELPLPITARPETNSEPHLVPDPSSLSDADLSDEDDSPFLPGEEEVVGVDTSSPASVRLMLPRPRAAVQRRATVSGASPTAKHPPARVEELWADIQRELQRRGMPTIKPREEPTELRGKSGSAMSLAVRPNTVLGSESSVSHPRTVLSPPSTFRIKLQPSSSSPLQQVPVKPCPPLPLKPLPQVPKYNAYTPPSSPYVVPTQEAPKPSAQYTPPSSPYVIPTQDAPKAASHVQIMSPPSHYAPKIQNMMQSSAGRSQDHSSAQSSFQFLDILPTSPVYSHTNSPPIIVLESEGTGDTLHERAVDCSPVPPPRPASSLRGATPVTSTPRGPAAPQNSARNLVARTVSRTKHKLSPRTDRKKSNNLQSKGRNVSCKQLGEVECEGWLLQRARAAVGASWSRAWFILKDTALYGFSNPEAKKADKLISLPGFTAAAAPEVKSRKFAFKVYHTGTAFYFAAGCAEELSRWLGCLASATLGVRSDASAPYFSETEDEEQPAKPPARAASSGNVSGADQETKGEDRRFGSLRRLAGGWRTDEGATSLDRKYLPRILRQEAVVPVPTAQFRSYRRVDR
ncbi:hypothetical protein B566_EDAN008384, partial [Ephemera danica]